MKSSRNSTTSLGENLAPAAALSSLVDFSASWSRRIILSRWTRDQTVTLPSSPTSSSPRPASIPALRASLSCPMMCSRSSVLLRVKPKDISNQSNWPLVSTPELSKHCSRKHCAIALNSSCLKFACRRRSKTVCVRQHSKMSTKTSKVMVAASSVSGCSAATIASCLTAFSSTETCRLFIAFTASRRVSPALVLLPVFARKDPRARCNSVSLYCRVIYRNSENDIRPFLFLSTSCMICSASDSLKVNPYT
mmetsp:Transcript_2169/g.6391  ORF Transcript_2169/g.6391 Transcript_2169/m.6391 type:complete len:250 (+) Transcript_2169:687-1436(+)